MNEMSFINNGRMNNAQAASYLGISKATLNGWRTRRKGPPYLKLGERVFYRREDLDEFISASLIHPSSN